MITANRPNKESGSKNTAGLFSDNPVIGRVTKFHVTISFLIDFREALSNYVSHSLNAKGNIMAEAYYQEREPWILWIIERWETKEELDDNDTGREMQEILDLTSKGLITPVEKIYTVDLEPLPKEAYRELPKDDDDPLTIMFFITAKQGSENRFKSIYHVAMPLFRSDPGVVVYQLSEDLADGSNFITYEKFRNRTAFDDHLKNPAAGPVVNFLESSIIDPPFEDGLHSLIEFAPLHRGKVIL